MRPHRWILGAVVALVLGAILVLLLGSAGPRYASKTTETATRDVYEGSAKVGELSVVVEQENNGVDLDHYLGPFCQDPKAPDHDQRPWQHGGAHDHQRRIPHGAGADLAASRLWRRTRTLHVVMTKLTKCFDVHAVADPDREVRLAVRD